MLSISLLAFTEDHQVSFTEVDFSKLNHQAEIFTRFIIILFMSITLHMIEVQVFVLLKDKSPSLSTTNHVSTLLWVRDITEKKEDHYTNIY